MNQFTIRELSERFGISASTLRYYEEIGLLENVEHKDRYHRIYKQEHVDRLGAIECFKKAGLSLEDMKQFFAYEKDLDAHSGDIVTLLKQQKIRTQEEIGRLQAGMVHLEKKIAFYSAVSEAIKKGLIAPFYAPPGSRTLDK